MKFARYTFAAAGVYGLLVLLPQYFLEAKNGVDFPPPINHPEFYYGFIGVAVAWQIMFLIVAKDPARYRMAMAPAVVEKASYACATIALYAQGRLALLMLASGIVDLAFGALFVVAFLTTRHTEH